LLVSNGFGTVKMPQTAVQGTAQSVIENVTLSGFASTTFGRGGEDTGAAARNGPEMICSK
jgi:hypothetical protein